MEIAGDDRSLHFRVDGDGPDGPGASFRPVHHAADPIHGDAAWVVRSFHQRLRLPVAFGVAVIASTPTIGGRAVFPRLTDAGWRNRGEGDASVMMIRPEEDGALGIGHIDVDGAHARFHVTVAVEQVVVALALRVQDPQLILVGKEQIGPSALRLARFIVAVFERFRQFGLVEFGGAQAVVAADLIDTSLRAFAKELTFVDVHAGGFAAVRQLVARMTLAIIAAAFDVDATMLAGVIGAGAAQAAGLVRMIRTVGEGVADAVARNAFAGLGGAGPFAGRTWAPGRGADFLVRVVLAVGDAVADARPRDAHVRQAALEAAQRTRQLFAERGDFVAAVAAVVFPVAAPQLGDAKRVVAGELGGAAALTAMEFVRAVRAI